MQRFQSHIRSATRQLQPFGQSGRLCLRSGLSTLPRFKPRFGADAGLSQFRFFTGTASNQDGWENVMSNSRSSQSDDAAALSKRVFVGNLPFGVDDDALLDEFSRLGNVASANIVKDRATGKSRGCGFVEFVDAEDAAAVLNMDGQIEIDGRVVNVMVPERRERQPRFAGNRDDRRQNSPSSVLFVGNTGTDLTAEDLENHFEQYGSVRSVRIPGRASTTERNFAHVEFTDVETAMKVMEDDDALSLSGQTLRLDYARENDRKNVNAVRSRSPRR